MRNILKNLLIIILSVVISACGYTLRGELKLPDDVKNIGVKTSSRRSSESYQIEIFSEVHNKRQLSMNQAGRVNEYELVFTTRFAINTPLERGQEDRITLYRDYLFDESRILGTTDREEEIRNEMMSTAASIIVNKLKAKIESM